MLADAHISSLGYLWLITNNHLTDNWQKALNLTDNWHIAKTVTDNWHLDSPPPSPQSRPSLHATFVGPILSF